MGERQRTVDELEKELEESEKATDAEEYSEHLDVGRTFALLPGNPNNIEV